MLSEAEKKIHIHSYIRMNKKFMKCDHPQCHHYLRTELLKNKESLCPVCHEETLILTREALRRAKPRCIKCSETKIAKTIRERARILKGLGFDIEAIESVKES